MERVNQAQRCQELFWPECWRARRRVSRFYDAICFCRDIESGEYASINYQLMHINYLWL